AREQRLDPVRLPEICYDVLAQQVMGMAVTGPVHRDEVLAVLRRAWPFRHLTTENLDRVLEYLEGGGRQLARRYSDVFGKIVVRDGLISVPSRRVEREFLMNIGTIPAEGMVTVLMGRRKLGQ